MRPEHNLYRAPLLLPVAGPPLRDGAVLTAQGRVAAVGPWSELRRQAAAGTMVTDYDNHVLMPALVNAHCHLELAHLAHLPSALPAVAGDLPAWIRHLLAAREQCGHDRQERRQAAIMALATLYARGCRTVIDIGNDPDFATLGANFKSEVFFHLELLGLSGQREEEALQRLAAEPAARCCTGHAPYSTGAGLLRALKKRSLANGCLLPLHVAEAPAEAEFVHHGTGPFRDFLEERGVDLQKHRPAGCSSVAWLDSLGLLDERTLCVHAVHVSSRDIEVLAARRAGVCLCPGANRHLGVGKAPLPELLAAGIIPALGTDSPAGNPHLSLWQEMKTLRQDHPTVSPATILTMATLAGTRLVGRQQQTGVIAPGVDSALLALTLPPEVMNAGEDAALEYLTTVGDEVRLEWME